MVVFFNTIDIAAINAMTIRLSQNPNWGGNHTHIHRLFLLELSESLTMAHNDRRSQQSRLSHKTKLALQSLGYDLKSHTQASPIQNDSSVATKKRCYLCPHHAVITKTIICTICEDNLSED